MNKNDTYIIVELFFNTTMAESYDIYKANIQIMVREEMYELIDAKVEEMTNVLDDKYTQLRKELEHKRLPDDKHMEEEDTLDACYEEELGKLYSTIGKEFDPEFAGTTEDDLVTVKVAAAMKLYNDNADEQLRLATRYIRTRLNLDDGDVVQLGGQGYRNENLRFWSTARGLLYPDYDSGSDYGTVPSEFRVGHAANEFSPWHWKDVIDYYDGLIWLSDTFREEIYASLAKVEGSDLFEARLMIYGKEVHITSAATRPRRFQVDHDDETLIEAFE
jgi:hypothetical protein